MLGGPCGPPRRALGETSEAVFLWRRSWRSSAGGVPLQPLDAVGSHAYDIYRRGDECRLVRDFESDQVLGQIRKLGRDAGQCVQVIHHRRGFAHPENFCGLWPVPWTTHAGDA